MRILLCAHRDWATDVVERLRSLRRHRFDHVADPRELTLAMVRRARPRYAFFLDWSWHVRSSILDEVDCIGFHAAPLPAFRGGSPIQNQIARGIRRTTLTAFRMTPELDAGDILLEAPLSLEGSLAQIFGRMKRTEERMIRQIIAGEFHPRPQTGDAHVYPRRRPDQSEITDMDVPLARLYDHIRMLADPYPNAFLMVGKRRIVFKDARYDGQKISFRGEIS